MCIIIYNYIYIYIYIHIRCRLGFAPRSAPWSSRKEIIRKLRISVPKFLENSPWPVGLNNPPLEIKNLTESMDMNFQILSLFTSRLPASSARREKGAPAPHQLSNVMIVLLSLVSVLSSSSLSLSWLYT